LWRRARALIGKRFDFVKLKDKNGEEKLAQHFPAGSQKANGRKIRSTEITADLVELVVFMTNSFIRPTDIKHL